MISVLCAVLQRAVCAWSAFRDLRFPALCFPVRQFFYLHDIEQADILHSTQKNRFSIFSAFPFIFESRPAFPFYIIQFYSCSKRNILPVFHRIFSLTIFHTILRRILFSCLTIKTTFSSQSMASSPSLWPTITCSELSCSRTTRYLPALLRLCSTSRHQKFLLWRSPIPLSLASPLTTKPFFQCTEK